jgi:hypothetical protein
MVAGVLGVASSVAAKGAFAAAGRPSSEDPHATFVPQRLDR